MKAILTPQEYIILADDNEKKLLLRTNPIAKSGKTKHPAPARNNALFLFDATDL